MEVSLMTKTFTSMTMFEAWGKTLKGIRMSVTYTFLRDKLNKHLSKLSTPDEVKVRSANVDASMHHRLMVAKDKFARRELEIALNEFWRRDQKEIRHHSAIDTHDENIHIDETVS